MVHASPEGILLRQLAEQDGSNYFSVWITLEDFPKLSLAGTRSLIFLNHAPLTNLPSLLMENKKAAHFEAAFF